jgi:hypothetical protein
MLSPQQPKPIAQYKIANSKSATFRAANQTAHPANQILYAKYEMPDARYEIQDTRYQIRVTSDESRLTTDLRTNNYEQSPQKQTQTKPIRPRFFARYGTPKPKRTQFIAPEPEQTQNKANLSQRRWMPSRIKPNSSIHPKIV